MTISARARYADKFAGFFDNRSTTVYIFLHGHLLLTLLTPRLHINRKIPSSVNIAKGVWRLRLALSTFSLQPVACVLAGRVTGSNPFTGKLAGSDNLLFFKVEPMPDMIFKNNAGGFFALNSEWARIRRGVRRDVQAVSVDSA